MKERAKKRENFIRCICFFLFMAVILSFLTVNLRIHGISDNSENGFFNQTENSLDIIYLGNCHAYTSIRPSVVENLTGMKGYVLAASNLDAKMAYYYLKAALARQNPKCVVIETFPFAIYDSYVSQEELKTCIRKNAVDLPVKDWLEFIRDEIENGEENWIYYLFDLLFFHENWKELDIIGKKNISEDNGWCSFGNNQFEPVDAILQQDILSDELGMCDEGRMYLERIVSLLKSKEIRCVFLSSPYMVTDNELRDYNYIKEYSQKSGIPYLNLTDNTTLKEHFFLRKYMNESRHVNPDGADIVSAILANEIEKMKFSVNY